ncbi:flagellin [Atlantibacter sp.]|uniref:flagellin N-terminal helical domain-containing protein n=1 Tax=Atlantibacter sp. TaxID=1903473 RepID=UPI00289C4E72|nr:flagellin [Atlantibacter sp.]
MAQVINTNSLSLLTQNNLNKSQSSLSSAIQRLSSGLRINSAKDDAAGQAIANRFTSNIKGLTQASRNANDGISIAQTTEGSLSEINNNLQRVRELSVQATNGTNSKSDLQSIQAEITQRLGEIDRVSGQTQFNGVKVLASDQTLKIQVGANDGETIDINLQEITSKTLGLGNLDLTDQVSSKSLDKVESIIKPAVPAVNNPAVVKAITFSSASGSAPELKVMDDGSLAVKENGNYYKATYDANANSVSYSTSVAATTTSEGSQASFVNGTGTGATLVELADITGATKTNTAPEPVYTVYRNNSTGGFVVNDGSKTYDATVDMNSGVVTIGTSTTASTSAGFTSVSSGKVLTIPGTTTPSKAAITVNMSGISMSGTNELMSREVKDKDGNASTEYFVKNTGTDGKQTYYRATADLDAASTTAGKVTLGEEVMVDPLAAIDKALAQVDSLRSDLGAVQNRFDSTITNLGNTVNNLSSARSRIEDADYATEVSNMSRAQILQQAGTSVLAQANQTTQGVLSLLR